MEIAAAKGQGALQGLLRDRALPVRGRRRQEPGNLAPFSTVL